MNQELILYDENTIVDLEYPTNTLKTRKIHAVALHPTQTVMVKIGRTEHDTIGKFL
jgi:hypothetical protein